MTDDPTVDEQQLTAERAIAESDEAKRAADKRAAALGVTAEKVDPPDDAKPKSRKQTTR